MNQKGFSLVELIGMVVVLGVLMVITVPNIAGILKNNKENIVKEDINKIVSNAKNKINTKQAKSPPSQDDCVVMTLDYVDSNNDLKSGLNGGKYNREESFIVIRKEREQGNSYSYRYYVRLVEDIERNGGVQKYEVPLTEHNELELNSKEYLKNLPPTLEGNMTTLSFGDATGIIQQLGLSCLSVTEIYTS